MTRVRKLNLLSRKFRNPDLNVASSEKITVPAGTFDAWRIEATGKDGTTVTIWIDKATYRHVKTRAAVPSTSRTRS